MDVFYSVSIFKDYGGNMNLLDSVVELAKEVGMTDPIDFGYLRLDEEAAYNTIASELIERMLSTPDEHRQLMLLATATHLVINNMVLNMKLMENISR